MKRILCYGDSNTWGYDPGAYDFETEAFNRFPKDVRWTGVLAKCLEGKAEIIEEGFNGRTTGFEEPYLPGRSSMTHFPVAFYSHEPLDLIVMMLGTNDTKDLFCAQPAVIGYCLEKMIWDIRNTISVSLSQGCRILLIAPIDLTLMQNGKYLNGFSEKSSEKVRELPEIYRKIAERQGCAFLNGQDIVKPSPIDGIHMDASSHRIFGEAVAKKIKEMLEL